MNKETLIQESQAIIKVVDGAKEGLQSLYNHFEGDEFEVGLLNDFLIENDHTDTIMEEALFIEKRHLKTAVINAHNKYSMLLKRWHHHHSEKLTRLLTETTN